MKVLSIVSQKGGTGKTTLATHLSVESERNGQTTALIDLDPQASAAKWGIIAKQMLQRLWQHRHPD